MSEPEIMINDFRITGNQLKIHAVIISESRKFTPKLKIIFRRNNEIRRLPLTCSESFDSDEKGNICFFTGNIELDCVFLNKSETSDITVSYEIVQGNEYYNNPDVKISKQISGCEIGDEYLPGKEFDGITAGGISENPKEKQPLTIDYRYSYSFDNDKGQFVIKSEKIKRGSALKAFGKISRFIMYFSALFCCVWLIPFFLFEALMLKKSGKNNIGIGSHIKSGISAFIRTAFKDPDMADRLISLRDYRALRYYRKQCRKPIVSNRIAIISGRRDELGGNEKYVYDLLKDRQNTDFKILLSEHLSTGASLKEKKEFYKLYATSKIVIVDDYFTLLNYVKKRKDVTLIQLWHACGAFKTFGFSRIGKEGGPVQSAPNHRMYDYATVSSEGVVRNYAEGFGVSDSCILPTGIPRTDIFFDNDYKNNFRNKFYGKYPQLKDRKIILFAPTFRGAGQGCAYYPTERFDPNSLYEKTGEKNAVILKLHPFCKERISIKENYKDFIIDMSDEDELNDLLFVTDLLITDYSSSVFEASLLDIPMLFYAYDLYQYIADRDFYCDYEAFVPGKIVSSQEELERAVIASDYEKEKIGPFRNNYFSEQDGNASRRVADAIINIYEGRSPV